ncbi:conserved hypothetical protein [Levilactobacillus brevis KB290]|uniref:Uncharacterized protein n=1 Tax=Levilactobacillus brevis KB290 TaxID=1001583 RepID=M5AG69_LEVBR|nr:hypothetical protein [Levilactobacillus brevis]BAN07808.1 conserved hypothetical protein [Levilactobacillus brevis KB290]
MALAIQLTDDAMKELQDTMIASAAKAFKLAAKQEALPFWMKKGEAKVYANVDDKTLTKFIKDGLRVSVKDGVQRISKKSVDDYYAVHEI